MTIVVICANLHDVGLVALCVWFHKFVDSNLLLTRAVLSDIFDGETLLIFVGEAPHCQNKI